MEDLKPDEGRISAVILCDTNYRLKQKIYDSTGILDKIDEGESITSIFDESSKNKSINFLDDVVINGTSVNWGLNVNTGDTIKKYFFGGFLLEDSIFIFVLKENGIDLALCRSILEINREAIQLLNFGQGKKQDPVPKEERPNSDDIYNSLSSLNNELINTQRQLRKKQKEMEILNKKLELMTITDELTGLYNRRYFWVKIEEELKRADRLGYSIALISIDINNFKTINDTKGHDEGDRVLKAFATITHEVLRDSFDFAFRWGGDEFTLILNNCTMEQAQRIMKRLDKEFIKHTEIASLAAGIVLVESTKDIDIERLIKIADKKMYKDKASKKDKRNRD